MDESTGVAVADAPVSTAPSSSLPASPSPTADRPTSFAEAMTRAVGTAPTTPDAPVPTGDPSPAAAIAQPPPVTTAPADAPLSPETRGPIPYDRHEAALKNARTKTENEVTQRFQQQYAPHVELGTRFQTDPVGTAVQVIQELSAHPDHGPQITSALARMLGARRGVTAVEDQAPEADLQTSDGTLVFSAPQLAKREAWVRQQMLQEVGQLVQPLQQREQQAQAKERYDAASKDAHDRMSKVLAPFAQQPDFEAHRPAIVAKVKTFLADGHDPGTALGLAYATVLHETVLPSRAAHSQQQLVAQAVEKSLGSTHAPGSVPAAPSGRPRSFEAAFSRLRA